MPELELLAGHLSTAAEDAAVALFPRPALSDPAINRIIRLTAAALRVPSLSLVFRKRDVLSVQSAFGPLAPPPGGFAADARVFESNSLVVLQDASGEPDLREAGIRFYAAAPVRNTKGEVAAVIAVADFAPRPDWSDASVSLLQDAAADLQSELDLRADVVHVSSALRESEERYRKLYDNIPIGVYRATPEGRIVMANQALVRMLGFPSLEAMLAEPDNGGFREDDGAVFRDELETGGEVHGLESRWRRRDGGVLVVRENARLLRNARGAVRYWEGTAEDITESKRIHDVLAASEARFEAFMENNPWGAFIKDRDGRRVYVNRRRLVAGGGRSEDWLGRNDSELYPPEIAAQIRENDLQVLESGRSMQFLEHLPDSDGQLREYLVVKFPFTSASGEKLLGGIAIDRTERLITEKALRASEERFRIASEITSDVICDWDIQGGKIRFYGHVGERFGFVSGRAYSNAPRLLSLVHKEDRKAVICSLRQTLREGGRHELEFRLRLRDDSLVDIRHRGIVLRDEAGAPYRYIGASTDVTRRKRSDEEIVRLAALVQSSGDAIIGLSLDGCIVSWNHGAEGTLLYPAHAVQGWHWTVIAPENRREEFRRIVQQVRRGGSISAYETAMRRSDGSEVVVSLSVSPIRGPSGQPMGISAIARDVTDRKRVEEQLAHQADHDQLTGLANRRRINSSLESAIANARMRKTPLALVYIDLDGFKLINDSYGHAVGDVLLQQVARRVEEQLRQGDLLARMGGDEFMLLLEGGQAAEAAHSVAGRVLESFQRPFQVAGRQVFVDGSIGISLYPIHARDAVALQKSADAAMYEAKRAGKGRIRFYTPEIGRALRERLELGNALRSALERNELRLEYQPQFSLSTMEMTGMEALLRWDHPERGLVQPSKFIPIAEETGLILPIGEWVIHEVCRNLRIWADAGLPAVRTAVNVSAVQFAAPEFVDTVKNAIATAGIPPHWLELELTESVVFGNFDEAAAKMIQLRELGVELAMDDFGTGFSSLSYLQRLPIHSLKIDRSFVSAIGVNEAALTLIRTIVSLSRGLGLRVVVEGLETEAQMKAAAEAGCDHGQGYLLGYPKPADYWLRAPRLSERLKKTEYPADRDNAAQGAS